VIRHLGAHVVFDGHNVKSHCFDMHFSVLTDSAAALMLTSRHEQSQADRQPAKWDLNLVGGEWENR
jgi:hypothetical protein